MRSDEYDSYNNTIQFHVMSWKFRDNQRYWGYVLPKLHTHEKETGYIYQTGEWWTEHKTNLLMDWLGKCEPEARRIFNENKMGAYCKRMGFNDAQTDQIQTNADSLKRQIKWDGKTGVDRSAKILCSIGSGWAMLEAVRLGLIQHPDEFLIPPIVRNYLNL